MTNIKNTSPTINIISALFSIGISAIYLTYILHLEKSKCICSLNSRQRFIKIYIIVNMVIAILNVFRRSFFPQFNYLERPINIILGILFIVYFVILGQWLTQLHKSKCVCSNDWRKTIIQVIYIISLFIFILIIIFMIYVGYISLKRWIKKNKKKK
jgi:quinol-cytochrome oxidoreductase complex cytochrome b subunit